jgi:DNA polymerase III epsilon subunit-like protein
MTQIAARPDLYISADVETDGPVPGPFSMLSFGLSVAGTYDGNQFLRPQRGESCVFYRELKPISDKFDPEALRVNGLDRDELSRAGADPSDAMSAAARWVTEVSDGFRPVLVAYPVAFDWSFLYWYFAQFADSPSPFGHSSCLDIRTLYQAVAGNVFDRSGKSSMPDSVLPSRAHTHNALDDALEQGELFANLFEFARARRNARVHSVNDSDRTPSWIRRKMVPLS